MTKKRSTSAESPVARRYRPPDIPMAAIRRYPGKRARNRQATAALRWAEQIRGQLRARLGLKL